MILASGILVGFFVVQFIILWAFYHYFKSQKQALETKVRLFLTAPDETTCSPFAELIRHIGSVLGYQVAQEIKTSLLGTISVAEKQQRGIMGDIASDALEGQSPMISLILDQFPSVKKRILKNPSAIPALLNLIGNKNLPGLGPRENSGSQSNNKNFSL